MKITPTTKKRLDVAILKFKKILKRAKERDVNEADTVTIVIDMLSEVFGFDKFSEITKEHKIKGSFCDLAVKLDERVEYLIEVKAIGLNLKENHLKQAVNYASHAGVKWAVLTNGINWEVYRVNVEKKVTKKLLFSWDFLELKSKDTEWQKELFALCKRGIQKKLVDHYYEYQQAVNPYMIGAILLSDGVVKATCRELSKLKKGIRIETKGIKNLMQHEVIKRNILEDGAGKKANKLLSKHSKQLAKSKLKPNKPNSMPVKDSPE